MKINIAIADDHQLFLKSLSILIESFSDFEIVADAMNGEILLKKLEGLPTLPDIILIDVNMPVLDGSATAKIIAEKYPSVKQVALSMKDDDTSVIQMIRAGCCAYLLKEIHPDELEKALNEIHKSGYYNADISNIRYRQLLRKQQAEEQLLLSERELCFLKYACSDLTYKQIADRMHLAERTIDGYRENLFQKLNVQSRVGMVLEALRRKLVDLNEV
jgi:DNA-binding NarL/FixJ family response regulator